MNRRDYMGHVAELSCACCGASGPSQVHHVREGQGLSQRANDFLTVPLCPTCHTGSHGMHGSRAMLRTYKKSEMGMLADTIQRLMNG